MGPGAAGVSRLTDTSWALRGELVLQGTKGETTTFLVQLASLGKTSSCFGPLLVAPGGLPLPLRGGGAVQAFAWLKLA